MIKFYYHPSPNPAINNDITGCFDPNPDLIAFHGQHDDFDIIADAHRLVYFARQNQHQSPTDLSLIASAVNADRRGGFCPWDSCYGGCFARSRP